MTAAGADEEKETGASGAAPGEPAQQSGGRQTGKPGKNGQNGKDSQEKRLARSAARLAAVQALYQMEMTGAGWRDVRREFEDHRIGVEIEGEQYREADIGHFRALLEGVVTRQREIDKLTDAALVKKWPLGRVDATLRALFRCAGFELLAMPHVPARVVINEYVDVASAFFPDGREPRFANAVLDHVARDARPEELGRPTP